VRSQVKVKIKVGTPHKATERHLPYGITQVNAPRLNPSQIGRYSIYLPCKNGRLNWPRRLVTYGDGLPARRQSPIACTNPARRNSNFVDRMKRVTATPPHCVSESGRLWLRAAALTDAQSSHGEMRRARAHLAAAAAAAAGDAVAIATEGLVRASDVIPTRPWVVVADWVSGSSNR